MDRASFKLLFQISASAVLALCTVAPAATYYVSPRGSDLTAGTSADSPWKTCARLKKATLQPGDFVLFQRGGEWRERLEASASGTAGSPITYDAYGDGAKPRFFGSDVLTNANFKPAGPNQYSYHLSAKADSALVDHMFLAGTFGDETITITTAGSDPRTDGKLYTACIRGNVIFSAGKNHLVFRNLIVDETAGQLNEGPNQGYGVRIEGSTDVLIESCEAYRCGRHNFAVINSTGFVGRHLVSAYVVPDMPGDNTAYVSYADAGAPVAACTSEWDDITATHMDDGKGGMYLTFVSHGDHQGPITIMNSTASAKLSFMTAPVVLKNITLRGNGSIENFGAGAMMEGIRLFDSAAIDQYGSGGTIQNCVAMLNPTAGGPTGYSSAIVLRDKAKQNVVRFNTLVTKNFTALCVAGSDSATAWYGNIAISDGSTLARPTGPLDSHDIARADCNFYSPTATFGGESLTAWMSKGFDAHALTGDPKFVSLTAGNATLQPDSPCIGLAKELKDEVPILDAAGKKRSRDIGAFQAAP